MLVQLWVCLPSLGFVGCCMFCPCACPCLHLSICVPDDQVLSPVPGLLEDWRHQRRRGRSPHPPPCLHVCFLHPGEFRLLMPRPLLLVSLPLPSNSGVYRGVEARGRLAQPNVQCSKRVQLLSARGWQWGAPELRSLSFHNAIKCSGCYLSGSRTH